MKASHSGPDHPKQTKQRTHFIKKSVHIIILKGSTCERSDTLPLLSNKRVQSVRAQSLGHGLHMHCHMPRGEANHQALLHTAEI
jgi:hypothetical protein